MTISAKSMFDIGCEGRLIHEGVELFRGWNIASDPAWSRDEEAVLRIDAARFPEPQTLALKIEVFHPETIPAKVLRISSDGHAPIETPASPSGVQSVLIQTPVMQPGATCGFVAMRMSIIDSPARLKISVDDRLLGFHILSVIEDVTLDFPMDMTRPGIADAILLSGWDRVEEGIGVWSLANEVRLVLPGYIDLAGAEALSFDVNTLPRPEEHAPLQVELWHKDHHIETWRFDDGPHGTRLCPLGMLNAGEEFDLTFRITNLVSPQSLGINADKRQLGLMLKSIDIVR